MHFSELSGTCEYIACQLRKHGIGANIKHAEVITPEEEEQLWNSGAMGIFSPKVCYVRFNFFYTNDWQSFCLRGGAEQRSLKPSPFVHGYDPDRYTYTENGSKNHKRYVGLELFTTPIKWLQCTRLMMIPFKTWFTCLTHTSKASCSAINSWFFFYLQPRATVPSDPKAPGYHPNPMGKNNLNSYVVTNVCARKQDKWEKD